MARLSGAEFDDLIEVLVSAYGLGKLHDRLARLNALVSRRRAATAEALSRQLYQLTGGLERDALPSRALLALWEEFLGSKIDEENAQRLESLAERINECLTAHLRIDPEKEPELRKALDDYQVALSAAVGDKAARITMLNRAVPDVAEVLRQGEPDR